MSLYSSLLHFVSSYFHLSSSHYPSIFPSIVGSSSSVPDEQDESSLLPPLSHDKHSMETTSFSSPLRQKTEEVEQVGIVMMFSKPYVGMDTLIVFYV